MRQRVRAFDWSATPLGPIDRWPQSLRVAVDICLNSRFPMFVWWGPDLINIYNDAYAPMLGARHPAALGRPAHDSWADIWDVVGRQADIVMRQGKATWNERVQLIMERYGYSEETYFTWSYSPIIDEAGKVGGLFCAVVEETQRIRAERERDRLAEQRQIALDAASMGWWHYDPGSGAVTYDERFAAIFGVPTGEASIERLYERIHADDRPGVRARVNAAVDPGDPKPYGAQYRVVRDDGSERWVEVHGRARFTTDEAGARRPVSLVGTVADVTERLRIEQRPRVILESITDAFFSLDRDWRFTYLNSAAGRLLARRPEDLIGRSIWAEFPEAVGSTFEREYRRAVTDEETVTFEEFFPPLNAWFAVRAYPSREGLSVYFQNVNDRVRTERTLVETQRRLQVAESAAQVGLWELDLANNTAFWSDGLYRLLGLDPGAEAATVDGWSAHMHADDRQRVWAAFAADIAAGKPELYYEFRIVRADGAVRWVNSTGRILYDAQGKALSAFGGNQDITERKRAEEALREARQRADFLSRAIDSSSLAFAAGLPDGTLLVVNPAFTRLTGYTEAELRQLSWATDLTPPEWREHEARQVAELVRTGRAQTYQKEYVRKDGTRVPIEIQVHLTRGEGGEPRYHYGFVTDITERRRIEERLRTSEERLALSIESGDLGTFYCPMPLGRIEWNAKCKELFWLPPDAEVDFDLFYAIIHPDDRERTREAVNRAVFGGEPYDVEYRTVAPDGRQRWIRAKGRAFYDAEGKPRRFDGVALDVTDRQQAMQERERLLEAERAARGEAERASRMKDEFLATLSHELRTPLNAILGWSQILAGGARDEADLSEGLAIIERNARAQTQIIEDLLEMSRIISGKVRLDVRRVDLANVIRAAVDTVRPAAAARGVNVVIAPAAPGTGTTSGDPNRLQQVFWNLLSNAVKFSPRGGEVRVAMARAASQLQVTVSDTGEGIRPEFLPHVFDRFRQADASTTRRHGGLGLGLAIVKQLVELHGGSVTAASGGAGQGSAFTVTLPLAALALEPEPSLQPNRHDVQADAGNLDMAPEIPGVDVVVVDDEADARAMVRRLLEECGATVRTAASAAEAVALIQARVPDVLVSDIGMPGEDGYSLIQRVRALPATRGGTVPAIALTAYARTEDRVRAMRAGYHSHVVKPVEPVELVTVVAALAGQRP